MHLIDCLDNSDCATGASCIGGLCGCNTGTPVLVGDSASDTSDECVECTDSNFGSCEPNDSCDTSTNLCVGMLFCYILTFVYLFCFIVAYSLMYFTMVEQLIYLVAFYLFCFVISQIA